MTTPRYIAITLLRELVSVEVLATKQVNSKRGLTKKTVKRERDAIAAVFRALTGYDLDENELKELSE